LAHTGGAAPPLWPAAGVALGALMIWGPGLWPGVLLGSSLTVMSAGLPAGPAVVIGSGNTLAALGGVLLLRRLPGFRHSLGGWTDVAGITMLAGLVIGAVTAEGRQDHAALREAAESLKALFDAAPAAIVATDADRRITRWNPAAERIFGYSAAEVMGKPLPYIRSD